MYMNEMNASNNTKEGEKELGLFCHYKVLALLMKCIVLFERGIGFL